MENLQTELSPQSARIVEDIHLQMEHGNLEVPMLPEVAHRVMMLVEDPDSDIAQLSNLIQSDPALAANVMRISNSAAYSPTASIISLQQAITRLGMKEVGQIALCASVNADLFKAPEFESRIADIMQLSLVSALWAREI